METDSILKVKETIMPGKMLHTGSDDKLSTTNRIICRELHKVALQSYLFIILQIKFSKVDVSPGFCFNDS